MSIDRDAFEVGQRVFDVTTGAFVTVMRTAAAVPRNEVNVMFGVSGSVKTVGTDRLRVDDSNDAERERKRAMDEAWRKATEARERRGF